MTTQYRCPKCGATNLEAKAMHTVQIVQDGLVSIYATVCSPSTWTAESPMWCPKCGYSGTAYDFDRHPPKRRPS
jgi:predicted nucleic-acid-binding Zn-ribbon protein